MVSLVKLQDQQELICVSVTKCEPMFGAIHKSHFEEKNQFIAQWRY